jgi:tetratricopeptide (TPR) repeat protein
MTSNASASPNKAVLALMFLGLLGMFAWSFVYRAANPSLIAAVTSGQDSDHGGPGEGGPMGAVMQAMQRLQANPEDLGALEAAGEAFAEAEMWDKALSVLEKAHAKDPNEPHVLNLLGVALFRLERPAESAQKFEMLLKLDPTNNHAQFNLGAVYKFGLSDMAKARPYFEAVIANPKTDPQTREQAKQELAGP